MASVANYHDLRGFKQLKHIPSQFWTQKSKIKVLTGSFSSGGSEEGSALCISPSFWQLPKIRVSASPFHVGSSSMCLPPLSPFIRMLILGCRVHCNLGLPPLEILSWITSANTQFPNKVTVLASQCPHLLGLIIPPTMRREGVETREHSHIYIAGSCYVHVTL